MKLFGANSGSMESHAVRLCLAVAFAVLLLMARPVAAQTMDPMQNIAIRPDLLRDVSIDQHLNAQVPMDLMFRDEHGKPVMLGQFFAPGKPVVLSLVYYTCPMLCTEELNGLDRVLKQLPMSIGKDFQVVTVSIDPTDKPIMAEAKQELYTGMYGRPGSASGWHFLTGQQTEIKVLADAIGYHYAYDPATEEFAHAALITVLTGQGTISRYFYGVNYAPRDVRFGLEDASDGKIGPKVDQVLLFCYHYDPNTGKYGVMISRAIQVGGALTLLALGTLIFFLARGENYSLPRSGRA